MVKTTKKAAKEAKSLSSSACAICTIEYWSTYFDIDQVELAPRLKCCLNPTSNDLMTRVSEKPDLYGPFWICAVLVFMLSISGNFLNLLLSQFTNAHVNTEYDFAKIGYAISLVYSFFGLFPAVFISVNKILGSNIPVVAAASVYGYSFIAYIGACIIAALITSSLIRFIAVVAAFVHSVLFILKNFSE